MSETLDTIRSRIEALGMNFKFKKPIKTSMNHIERETWLLEYEDSQFVYVAGQKNVTLGWDIHQCPLGDGVLDSLREYVEQGQEYYQDEIKEMKADYEQQIMQAAAKGNSKKAAELRAELAVKAVTVDALSAAATARSISCPAIPLFTANQSRNTIRHCPTTTFVIVGSFVCHKEKERQPYG